MPFVYSIDSVDKSILKILTKDSKMPYTEVADRLGLSHGTIHQRVKKLEKRGIIKSHSIVIDYNKLGYNFILFLGIIVGNVANITTVITALKAIPQITVGHRTSGTFNIFCKIRALDTAHAAKLIDKVNAIKGIIRTESMVSFEEFINSKEDLVHEVEAR